MAPTTEQFAAITQRTAEATTDAVRSWAEAVQHYTTSVSPEHPLPRPADVHAAFDVWFDLAGRLLAEQKAFTAALIDAGTDATDTFAERAREAAATVTAFRPTEDQDVEAPARPRTPKAPRNV